MERPLEGKLVLVTGGGVRLGRAIAEGLASAGANIALHFHQSEQGADAALASIRAEGSRAAKFQADLARSAEVDSLVRRVEAQLGPIAALVNSAAVFHRAPFLETSEEILDSQWVLNARAPYLLTQLVARRMSQRGEGDVVNILDVGGAIVPWRSYSAYCMSKAALAALTRCLALELAPRIRVNAVAPGTVLPPEELEPAALDELRSRIPQQRFGSPEAVVRSVLFLLTGPAFITGHVLVVDGGRSLAGAPL
jgi:NAD(P)-dependent dehydrogenase (short-subunit alcohol dehydrogenase family)